MIFSPSFNTYIIYLLHTHNQPINPSQTQSLDETCSLIGLSYSPPLICHRSLLDSRLTHPSDLHQHILTHDSNTSSFVSYYTTKLDPSWPEDHIVTYSSAFACFLWLGTAVRSFYGAHIAGDALDIHGNEVLTGSWRPEDQLVTTTVIMISFLPFVSYSYFTDHIAIADRLIVILLSWIKPHSSSHRMN